QRRVVAAFARDGAVAPALPSAADAPAQAAARAREPVICNDVVRGGLPEAPRDLLLAHGLHSVACFPIQLGGEVTAVLTLGGGETGAFDDDEQRMLRELAGDIAF